jgi:histone H3/H4
MRNMETIVNSLVQAVNNFEGKMQQVIQFVNNFQQAVRLDSTGKEIRLLGLQRLLIKKGLITEAEMTEASGDVIKEMQAQAEAAAKEAAEKAAKPEIVPATPEQVQAVTDKPNA